MFISYLIGAISKMGFNFKFEKLLENEFLLISLEPELTILQLTWKQHPNSEQFKNGYRLGIELMLKHGVKYWLSDSIKINYVEAADQLWFSMKLRPLLKSGKLHKFANVMNLNNYLMTDTTLVYENPEQEMDEAKANFHILFDLESAYLWLLEDNDNPKSI